MLKDWIRNIVCGVCIGMANIIPGVSGGTMAFILGIYDRLLNSIKSVDARSVGLLLRGRWREAFEKISWRFLLALVLGVGISLISLAKGVSFLLQHPIYRAYLFAVFFGLIIASVGFCARQVGGWRPQHAIALVIGAVVAFGLTAIRLDTNSAGSQFDVFIPRDRIVAPYAGIAIRNYSEEHSALIGISHATLSAMLAKNVIGHQTMVYDHHDGKMGSAEEFVQAGTAPFLDWWLIVCGALTVSAMLLPGISGSYILVVFGAYALVVGALADFGIGIVNWTFPFGPFVILLNFYGGMVLGAVGFSRLASWLLRCYRGLTIATLTGFMVGAIWAVWPFWSYEYRLVPLALDKGPQLVNISPRLPVLGSSELWITLGLALLGFAVVFTLEAVAGKKKEMEV